MTKVPRFILASASPRRHDLLAAAGYAFAVVPSSVAEPPPTGFSSAPAYVAHVAWLKAADVTTQAHSWVLAADTVAVVKGLILGKPSDRADAARILRLLMGTRHQVLTGVCLILPRPALALSMVVSTDVAMRRLSEPELEAYLDGGLWEGKAGAYGIQDHDDPFVEAVNGSYSNVMGLPMEKLEALFTAANRVDPAGGDAP